MPLFSNISGKFQEIQDVPVKYERDLQELTENNLESIFGLEFVKSEFELDGLRIDTLAFDRDNKSFVLIEFKRDTNYSVIDQGFAYLNLMLNKKADFILEFNERKNENLKRDDIDWSQSKVIFISPSFTTYQLKAMNFKDLPIELWNVTQYQNNLIHYEQLKPSEHSESIKTVSRKSEIVERVSKEIQVYTENDHFSDVNATEITRELYERLKEGILRLGENITIKPGKIYIGYKARTNFCDIEVQKSKLTLFLNLEKGQLDDPKGIAKDVSNKGHHGNGDYLIHFSDISQLNYILDLIQQSYEKNH